MGRGRKTPLPMAVISFETQSTPSHLTDHQKESETLSLEQLFVPAKPCGSNIRSPVLGVAVSGTILDQDWKSLPGAGVM